VDGMTMTYLVISGLSVVLLLFAAVVGDIAHLALHADSDGPFSLPAIAAFFGGGGFGGAIAASPAAGIAARAAHQARWGSRHCSRARKEAAGHHPESFRRAELRPERHAGFAASAWVTCIDRPFSCNAGRPSKGHDVPSLAEIRRMLADAYGIATRHGGGQAQDVEVADSTLEALLTGFGVETSSPQAASQALERYRQDQRNQLLPPTMTGWQGTTTQWPIHLVPARSAEPSPSAWVELEDREGRRELSLSAAPDEPANEGEDERVKYVLSLPPDLPLGYHTIHLAARGIRSRSHLVVAPEFLGMPVSVGDTRLWGFATQLYSIPSRSSWGLGDLADLRQLARWSASEHSAGYVLINPINAAAPLSPMEPSPYLPMSRRYFNPIYLRIEEIPEFDRLSATDRAECDRLRLEARDGRLGSGLIDRDTAWSAKRKALALIHTVSRDQGRDADYRSFVGREGEELTRYATWSALAERRGTNWPEWPVELRDPESVAVQRFSADHGPSVEFHVWLQWLVDGQLAALQRSLREVMGLGVIHDLPVGVHPEGADTWADQAMYARTASVGAPPDAFNQLGQNWAQHPWRPDELARCGYVPFRRLMSNLLRHSGGVRIDHIIGLFRLWWIPEGEAATAGSYVHYDHEAFLGIAALEAERSGALIVGEDLGTVPPGVQDFLTRRGILGTSVLWFEEEESGPRPPEKWRPLCMASVTTHDLPPAASFVSGEHVDVREELGLLTGTVEEERKREKATLDRWIHQLKDTGALGDSGNDADVVEGLYRYLGATACALINVALGDAVGDRHLQNVPGTSDSYPNWLRQVAGPDGQPVYLEDVMASPAAARLVSVVATALKSG